MNYDDWKATDPMDGQWDRRAERIEPDKLQPCRYCANGEYQLLWPPEAPAMTKCRVCGDTRAMREASTADVTEAFAALVRRGGKP